MPNRYFDRLFTQAPAELRKPRSIALAALFVALHVILNQFTIPLAGDVLQLSFDFLPLAAAGYLCGPWVAALAGGMGDVLGYIMRPSGPYFAGFTLSAILMGMLYGLWYYKKPVTLWRSIAGQLTNVAVFNFFLTPLWLHMLYGQAFVVLSSMRLLKNLLQFPFSVALTMLVLTTCRRAAGSLTPMNRR